MKRSEINAIIQETEEFFRIHRFRLPEWGRWDEKAWKLRLEQGGREALDEIHRCSLGWDITDFGSGNFTRRGLVLFTLRNGLAGEYPKPYAEKIMMVREDQETPFHFHWNKMEDIINRGGGELVFELYLADAVDGFSGKQVTVSVDGLKTPVEPGGTLTLSPGQSLTLEPRVYHRFYARPGGGPVLCGEVSMVNDDHTDNRFYESLGRFPEIDEDEPPYRLMVGDYGRLV